MGGLHLESADETVLEKIMRYTDRVKADNFTIYGGHCTGKGPLEAFRGKYGKDVVRPYGSGTVITH